MSCAPLLIECVKQLCVRPRKCGNAVRLQLLGDGKEIQAEPRGTGERRVIRLRRRLQAAGLYGSVIAKRFERGRRNRGDGVGCYQSLEVEDIGISRIFRPRARPERPLNSRASSA